MTGIELSCALIAEREESLSHLYNPIRKHDADGFVETPVEAQAPDTRISREAVRQFATGATRSPDVDRYDPEGFLSPIAVERYCVYMAKNQIQSDGSRRSSDNWQKGMPIQSYMKGMWRHFLHLWTRHRGYEVQDPKAAADMEEDLCALLFNVQGMLHEVVKARLARREIS